MEQMSAEELAEIEELVGVPSGNDRTTLPHAETVTAAELGEWLGLTANRVSALARDGVIPRDDAKRFPLRPAIRAYCDHTRAGAVGRRVDSELAAEKLRLAREQADKIAFANARARGELLDSREVATAWRNFVTDLRAGVMAIPSRVATRLALDRKASATLDAEVREVLTVISNDGDVYEH